MRYLKWKDRVYFSEGLIQYRHKVTLKSLEVEHVPLTVSLTEINAKEEKGNLQQQKRCGTDLKLISKSGPNIGCFYYLLYPLGSVCYL